MPTLLESPPLMGKRIPIQSLVFKTTLSTGASGEVWLAQLKGQRVAVKQLLQTNERTLKDVKDFVDEIRLSASLGHQHVVSFIGVAWSRVDNVAMVMEFCPMGDLRRFLAESGRWLSWSRDKIRMAIGIAQALRYLHEREPPIIHRDLKSKNILLTDTLEAKISDFGVSRSRKDGFMTAGVGTPYWIAPEILEGKRYTEQADIYSFGVVLSELDTCKMPFSDVVTAEGKKPKPVQILHWVLDGRLSPTFSDKSTLTTAQDYTITFRSLEEQDPESSSLPSDFSFDFDGTNSDIARQLYTRHRSGDTSAAVSIKSVPTAVTDRLDSLKIAFTHLPGLVQLAVLWDTGFGISPNGDPVQIWTTGDFTMADIAVSPDDITNVNCTIADDPTWNQCPVNNGYSSLIVPCHKRSEFSDAEMAAVNKPKEATHEQARRGTVATTSYGPSISSHQGDYESAGSNQTFKILLHSQHLLGNRIPYESLSFQMELSKGASGEAWICQYGGQPVAVKKLLHTKDQKADDVQAFAEEIELTASLIHPHIVKFIGVAWNSLSNLSMVLEFVSEGDLQGFLHKNSDVLSWAGDRIYMAVAVAEALEYLHSRSPAIIHRDLKSNNILLTEDLDPKLIDFGVSRGVMDLTMTAGVGTPYWTAPEVLEGARYSEKADIYSFGVVLSELDTGRIPYFDTVDHDGAKLMPFQILQEVMAGTLRPSFSQLFLRHRAGEIGKQVNLSSVPAAVSDRLDALNIDFDDLPGLVQLAVLWDSGFVISPDYDPIQIWTMGNYTMADLAVPKADVSYVDCTYLNCSQPNGVTAHYAQYCTGWQMLNVSRCVADNFVDPGADTYLGMMWSTGGDPTMTPSFD
ncbi:hypothetical protein PInf_009509 [Phytophthora infestans]|nr:hypothetical protein PInf_009509 [Phytophthora infestans]